MTISLAYRVVLAGAGLLLCSCVTGPVSLNVRVHNDASRPISVSNVGKNGQRTTEVVQSGKRASAYGSGTLIKLDNHVVQVRNDLESVAGDEGYRFKHSRVGHLSGAADILFEVAVDGQGRTWGLSPEGTRVPFPSVHK